MKYWAWEWSHSLFGLVGSFPLPTRQIFHSDLCMNMFLAYACITCHHCLITSIINICSITAISSVVAITTIASITAITKETTRSKLPITRYKKNYRKSYKILHFWLILVQNDFACITFKYGSDHTLPPNIKHNEGFKMLTFVCTSSEKIFLEI